MVLRSTFSQKTIFFKVAFLPFLLILLSLAVPLLAYAAQRDSCFIQHLCLTTIEDNRSAQLLVRNNFDIPIRVSVNMTGRNVAPSKALNNIPLLPGETKEVFHIKAKRGKSWRYTWTSELHPGLSEVQHNEDIRYDLPFSSKKTFPISQGPNGSFSHYGVNKNAIDWAMPIGTKILAAREGMVIGYRENARAGGPLAKFKSEQNYIWIQHNDRTIGQYLHLKENGVTVEVGDYVERGQLIGYSGNTGYSAAPHLHFHVSGSQEQGQAFRTFPILFKTKKSSAKTK
ncbi:M23 family metallopeptidase [Kiloniella antarctica]|uniref:M23 family metallopeptidase n=1 Tax=Kiloniella antarctica TaxID=1550907 RepID=A0ABW5BR78_9PROT